MGLNEYFSITDKKIECYNGTKFIFKGLYRNITGIKSTEGIDYCWIEEAQSISQESIDFLWPTVRTPGSQFFITFNPLEAEDPIYKRFITNERKDTLLININYWDNPHFPDVLRDEMLYDKEYNYDKYLHVWCGEVKNVTDACIFKDKFTIMSFDTHKEVDFMYGADWGYSNDPDSINRCYEYDGCLWIDYEAHGTGIEIEEIEQLWDHIPGSREHLIECDSARPDLVSYMKRRGFNTHGVRKSKGQNNTTFIEDGIRFLRSYKMIYVHERCKNTAYEFRSYSYKEDKQTGEILNVIVDKDNHHIDSIRYATNEKRRGRVSNYKPSVLRMKDVF